MPDLNANTGAFTYTQIEIRQFIFHNPYMHMYFLLTRTVKTLHTSTSTVFISLLNMHIFYQHFLTEDKERLEKKKK